MLANMRESDIMDEVKNVKIIKADIEIEDHGLMTFHLLVEGNGFGVSIGNYVGFNDNIIRAILDTVGVNKWSELNGKYCRIKTSGWGSIVKDIGNIIEDKWINLEELYNKEYDKERGEDDE